MELEVRDFLLTFDQDELIDRGVVQRWGRNGSMFQGKNLYYLLRLMRDEGVELLTHGEEWSLNVNGDFVNSVGRRTPWSGNVSQLGEDKFRIVFLGTNPVINPHYISSP